MGHETTERDEKRERRIAPIVDGSDDEYQRISAWYGYLEDHIRFPFTATYRSATGVAPQSVEVIDLACVDDFIDEALVSLGGTKYGQDVPLSEVQPTDAADEQTREAIADWHYWVKRGYHFWTETEK